MCLGTKSYAPNGALVTALTRRFAGRHSAEQMPFHDPKTVIVSTYCAIDDNRRTGELLQEAAFQPEVLMIYTVKHLFYRPIQITSIDVFTEEEYSLPTRDRRRNDKLPGLHDLEAEDELFVSARIKKLVGSGQGLRYSIHALQRDEVRDRFYIVYPADTDHARFLFVPAVKPTGAKTPDGRMFPEVPTVYNDLNEALVLPMLFELSKRTDDAAQDCAVLLQTQGAAVVPQVRVAIMGEADTVKGLPRLLGSVKQVAWASDIRRSFIQQFQLVTERVSLKNGRRFLPGGFKAMNSMDRAEYDKVVRVLEAQMKVADEAHAWINHRANIYAWLLKRANYLSTTIFDLNRVP